MKNEMIEISGASLPVIEYQGKRVVTFTMIDQVHQRPEGTARKRFHDNRARFIDGEDYFRLSYQEVMSLSSFRTAGVQANSQGLIILTQAGYLMLVKSLTDDLAWTVQRELVHRYFTPKSKARQLLQTAQALVEYEERVAQIESVQTQQQARIEQISQRQSDMDGDTGYATVAAYCRRKGIDAPKAFANKLGRKATGVCKLLNIRIGKVPDERWGQVNSYPMRVLDQCMGSFSQGGTQ